MCLQFERKLKEPHKIDKSEIKKQREEFYGSFVERKLV